MKSTEQKVDDVLAAIDAEKREYLVPCYAFGEMDEHKQLKKIENELAEVRGAWNDYERDLTRRAWEALLMECADVQVAVETLMMLCGANEAERREARRKVYEKNDKRGYYDEKL